MALLRKYWLSAFALTCMGFVGVYLRRHLHSLDAAFDLSPARLVIVPIAQLAFWGLTSQLWRGIVMRLAACELTLAESFAQLSLVNLGKYLPGKIWGVVARGAAMQQRHGITTEQVLLATYLEQFFIIGSAIVLSAGLGAVLVDSRWAPAVAAFAIATAVLGAYFNAPVLELLSRIHGRLSRSEPRHRSRQSMPRGIYARYLLGYLAVWVSLGLAYWGLYYSFFSAQVSLREMAGVIVATAASISIGFFALFAPGGIGVREAVSSVVLSRFIPLEEAIFLSVLFRLWTVAVELLTGFSVLWLQGRRR
ncbi:MAG: flippase-like domain-containing protein [Myxococcales bacterium]|nr:flippase-like domain-containing protein [Myxococcales bacterium]